MPFLLMENLKISSGWSRLLPMRCDFHMSVGAMQQQRYVAHQERKESRGKCLRDIGWYCWRV